MKKQNTVIIFLIFALIIIGILWYFESRSQTYHPTPLESDTLMVGLPDDRSPNPPEEEHQDIPPETPTTTFNVYFNNTQNDPHLIHCDMVYPITRHVPYTQGIGTAALNELIAGPTANELANGYSSSIPQYANINSLTISQGIALVDVDPHFFEVGGSCGIAAAMSSLKQTLLQFPTVDEVIVTVDGIPFSDFAQNLV